MKKDQETLALESYNTYLKPRPRDWHKGLSGHILIVGGEAGMTGAPLLAAKAALRVGAGLVTIATHPAHALFLNVSCPEIMCHGIEDAAALQPLLAKADVVVLGTGLGQSQWAHGLWSAAVQHPSLVIDADGLNILASHPCKNDHWILTPHPGEAARLLNLSVQHIQADRLQAAIAINNRYGGICALKGAGTWVTEHGASPAQCLQGNPGMATAGMGDVLSGVIGGLLAQGIPAFDAAKLGVLVHAMAGDLAAKAGERGMMATDLMPYLRQLVNP